MTEGAGGIPLTSLVAIDVNVVYSFRHVTAEVRADERFLASTNFRLKVKQGDRVPGIL